MTREQKLEAIYKEMANKKVSFGCRYKFIKKYQYCDWAWFEPGDIITLCKRDAKYEDSFLTTFFRDIALIKKDVYDYVEIIGHPVMIGDVLDRYRTNNNDYKVWEIDPYDLKSYSAFQEYDIKRLLNLWTGKRTLIDEQSDECIDFVHSLVKKS